MEDSIADFSATPYPAECGICWFLYSRRSISRKSSLKSISGKDGTFNLLTVKRKDEERGTAVFDFVAVQDQVFEVVKIHTGVGGQVFESF